VRGAGKRRSRRAWSRTLGRAGRGGSPATLTGKPSGDLSPVGREWPSGASRRPASQASGRCGRRHSRWVQNPRCRNRLEAPSQPSPSPSVFTGCPERAHRCGRRGRPLPGRPEGPYRLGAATRPRQSQCLLVRAHPPVTSRTKRPSSRWLPAWLPTTLDPVRLRVRTCRSVRVRREGLEPPTRGLRVRCSAS